tara:strand:- start:2421 stop:2687 length:267 start_codon:yes stop_codon:yes gene_type:complete
VSLFGLKGYSHGATNLVTVMSPDGIAAAKALNFDPDEIRTEFYPDILPQYHEKRAGGLERFIAQHDIIILEFKAWTARKTELGEAVYR